MSFWYCRPSFSGCPSPADMTVSWQSHPSPYSASSRALISRLSNAQSSIPTPRIRPSSSIPSQSIVTVISSIPPAPFSRHARSTTKNPRSPQTESLPSIIERISSRIAVVSVMVVLHNKQKTEVERPRFQISPNGRSVRNIFANNQPLGRYSLVISLLFPLFFLFLLLRPEEILQISADYFIIQSHLEIATLFLKTGDIIELTENS